LFEKKYFILENVSLYLKEKTNVIYLKRTKKNEEEKYILVQKIIRKKV
jgi:hypothetical protein